MKKAVLILLSVYVTLSASAQFVTPYKISRHGDEPVFWGGVTLLTTAYLAGNTWKLPSQTYITNLNRKDVNIFDRSATYQHSVSAAKVSDALLYSSIGLPLCRSFAA